MKNCLQYTLILFVALLLSCFSKPFCSQASEIHLSAAASMTDAVKELTAAYQRKNPDALIIFNYGSSGSLAKQIDQGAPAGIYISANSKWMSYLVNQQHIAPQSIRLIAVNSLVFVGTPEKRISSLDDITALSRVAIGSPASVPAGQYAEQAMRSAGIYEHMLTGRKLVMAKDVRQALLYADRGEVDGAFVYRTDALLAEHAEILFAVPVHLHERITCQIGLTPGGSDKPEVQSFYHFLTGPEAEPILRKFGFSFPTESL